MRLPSSSQSSSLAGLLILLANHAAPTSAAAASLRSTCLNTRSLELARLSACATDTQSLNACFLSLTDGFDRSVLEACYVNAGCSPEAAADEALWTLRSCEEVDLRKRQNTATGGNAAQTTAARGGNTVGAGARTTAAQAPTTAAPAAQPTTAAAQQTDADSSSSDAVVVVTATADNDSQSTSPAGLTSSGPLVCLTTTTISTTVCPVSTDGPNRGRRGPCTSTTIEYPTCASGLLCRVDQGGNPTCMRINNTLDTAGIVVALFFAVSITAAVGGLCFFCCRERRQQRKLKAKMEAAAIAASHPTTARPKTGMRNVSANSQTDRTPLMMGPGQPAPGQQDYADNPFADQRR